MFVTRYVLGHTTGSAKTRRAPWCFEIDHTKPLRGGRVTASKTYRFARNLAELMST